jgi:hypothetical protein
MADLNRRQGRLASGAGCCVATMCWQRAYATCEQRQMARAEPLQTLCPGLILPPMRAEKPRPELAVTISQPSSRALLL